MAQKIYTILKQEHSLVKKELGKMLRKRTGDFEALFLALKSHMEGEEAHVYPIMEEYPELKEMVIEAIEEHRHAKMLLEELGVMDMGDEKFYPKLKVLKEMIEHHVEDEEDELFPAAKKTIKKELEDEILEGYMNFKENFEG
jgi:hemerythrin-like domain-containing protein